MNNYELSLEKDNLTEHLRITTENLQIVNGELSNTLLKCKEAKNELDGIYSSINSAIQELTYLKSEIAEKKVVSDNIIINALKIDKESKERLDKTKLWEEQATHEIGLKISSANKEIINLNKEIDELNSLKTQKTLSISLLDHNINEKENDLSSIVSQINASSKLYNDNLNEIDKQNKEIDKLEKFYTRRSLEINNELQNELSKVEKPMLSLKEFENQLLKKERNLNILKNRFEIRFKKVFPEQSVNI